MEKAESIRVKLDDKKVDHWPLPASTAQVEILDTLMPGLRLRVSSKGAKAWTVLTRALVDGEKKLVRATLGHYPLLKVAAARDAAREYLRAIQEGANPLALKAEKQAVKVTESVNTFGAVLQRFLKEKSKKLKAKTFDEYERVLGSADFKPWEHRTLKSITRADVRAVLAEIEERVSSVTANKAFVYLRVLFNWAVETDIIPAAPTDRMKAPDGADKRTRVLTDDELRIFWSALPSAGVFEPVFALLALTGQRRDEITSLKLHEIHGLDGDAPFLQFAQTKNDMPHVVPLSPAAAAILRKTLDDRVAEKDCPFVFTTTGKTALSGFSRIKARLMQAVNEQTDKDIAAARAEGNKAHADRLDQAFYAERHREALEKALATAEKKKDEKEALRLEKLLNTAWRLHDLRRTLVTGLNDKGIEPHVVEAVVNHVSGVAKAGVAGVYNHARYLNERRMALELWARHIEGLVTPHVGATVLPMAARSA